MTDTLAVWNLYVKTKELGVVPSEYLRIAEYVERHYQLDGWWTCVQVDDAIQSVGRYIESYTTGFDENNKPKPSVETYFKRLDARKSGISVLDTPVTRLKRGSIGGTPPTLKKAK